MSAKLSLELALDTKGIEDLCELLQNAPQAGRKLFLDCFFALRKSGGNFLICEPDPTALASGALVFRVGLCPDLERIAAALRAGDFHSA